MISLPATTGGDSGAIEVPRHRAWASILKGLKDYAKETSIVANRVRQTPTCTLRKATDRAMQQRDDPNRSAVRFAIHPCEAAGSMHRLRTHGGASAPVLSMCVHLLTSVARICCARLWSCLEAIDCSNDDVRIPPDTAAASGHDSVSFSTQHERGYSWPQSPRSF